MVLGGMALFVALLLGDKTAPFVKKYWWQVAGVVISVVSAVVAVIRRRSRSPEVDLDEAKAGGDKIREESLDEFDAIVDTATEKALFADAELRLAKIESEEKRGKAMVEIDAIRSIEDPAERLSALAKLLRP